MINYQDDNKSEPLNQHSKCTFLHNKCEIRKINNSSLFKSTRFYRHKTEWGACKKYYNEKIASSLKSKLAQKVKSERNFFFTPV